MVVAVFVTQDKNFIKLPDCGILKDFPSNKKTVNVWRRRPNASLNTFMEPVFKSILLKCPVKSKEQN